ncbi:MAG: ribosome recycling factor [Candidatus Dasytiphilus stammeri]
MMKIIKQDASIRMEKCFLVFMKNINKIRTSRISPSILESLKIECYGGITTLRQISTIGLEDARTLLVTVFDPSLVSVIEKALKYSDLGLQYNTAGTVIRVSFPILTEERRIFLSKIVRKESEQGKICIRNVRRDANLKFKSLLKAKSISEDEEYLLQNDIQKSTDTYIQKMEQILATKLTELMKF